MKLGILVNSDTHPERVIGLTKAALGRGHEVIIFNMDKATLLLSNPAYSGLSALGGVKMAFCTHNAEGFGADTSGLPDTVVAGSQYDNAVMNNEADKVVVL